MQRSSLLAVVLAAALGCAAEAKTCPTEVSKRFECYPEGGASETSCNNRGCCWQVPSSDAVGLKIQAPSCFFPTDYDTYTVESSTQTAYGYSARLRFTGNAETFHRKGIISSLDVAVHHYPESKFVRVTIKDASTTNTRYSVPVTYPVHINENPIASPNVFPTTFTTGARGFQIQDANKRLLFSTLDAPMIYADQFIQLSSRIESEYAYGFGEVMDVFAKPTNTWRQYSLFALDTAPRTGENVYGVHPFGMFVRKSDASSHGIFLLNSNAMDIELTPYPAVTFRTIGGIVDLFLYAGETPQDVIKQHLAVVGRPVMPPYWALGFQLSRWGYNTADNLQQVIDRNVAAKIPYDVQWLDIDTFDEKRDWTVDPVGFGTLPTLVQKLHNQNMFVVPIVDPAIQVDKANYSVYDKGLAMDVFMRDNEGNILVGQVWPGNTTFPDFYHPNTSIWWHDDAKQYYDNHVKFDGLWIDMNEPANFVHGSIKGCPETTYDNPIYVPNIVGRSEGLKFKTVCMSAKHTNGVHYNLHSLYGHSEAVVTYDVVRNIIPGKRPFVVSRSTFPGTGAYAHHWTGDVFAKWEYLSSSIPDTLNFNLFGIPYVGADICGFFDNSTEELCIRWMQVGSFYPFMRNHNGFGYRDQDPAAWSANAQEIMRNNLLDRYRMLPYFYTLFYRSSAFGETVLRPLFWSFPSVQNTWGVNYQFMLGEAILVSPVVEENKTTVNAYVPSGTWYNLDGSSVSSKGETIVINAPLSVIPVHIREGYIIPFQEADVTTTASRKKPYYIVVALNAQTLGASGELYIDDGVSENPKFSHVLFTASNGVFVSKPINTSYAPSTSGFSENVNLLKVFGAKSSPKSVHFNGVPATSRYNATLQVLDVIIEAKILTAFNVTWEVEEVSTNGAAHSTHSQTIGTFVTLLMTAAVALVSSRRL